MTGEAVTTQGGVACPVCRAAARPRIDLGDYRLFACAACGCWSSDALARGARVSFEPVAYFANAAVDRARWDDLLRRLPLAERAAAAPPRVLDVGCGCGEFLRHVAARFPGSERFGIEPDPDRAGCAQAADPAAQICIGTVEMALGEMGGAFDLVTLWDVFEHLPDPAGVLGALAGRLVPGGMLFLQTIHEHSLVPRIGRVLYAASAGRLRGPARRTHEAHHLVFFSRRGLRSLAQRAGLGVRAEWFERLARERMDGAGWLVAIASAALAAERALGGGLFVNLLLERR